MGKAEWRALGGGMMGTAEFTTPDEDEDEEGTMAPAADAAVLL